MIGTLLKEYQKPGRYYHNQDHITDMLEQYLLVFNKLKDPAMVLLAILFHDIVYDPARKDNEELSAEVARQYMSVQTIYSQEQIVRVVQLIMATKKHDCDPEDTDMCYLIDMDLRGLGLSWEIFLENYDKIYREYKDVFSPAEFRSGRMLFLEGYSNKKLFKTPEYQQYEKPAKENMWKQLQELKLQVWVESPPGG